MTKNTFENQFVASLGAVGEKYSRFSVVLSVSVTCSMGRCCHVNVYLILNGLVR